MSTLNHNLIKLLKSMKQILNLAIKRKKKRNTDRINNMGVILIRMYAKLKTIKHHFEKAE